MNLSKDEIGHVRQVSRLFVRELGILEAQNGITLSQCHALVELERHGVLNIKKLAEILHVDASTMSRNVKRLIMQGWVTTTTDRRDRRARLLTLTDAGRDKLQIVDTCSNEMVGQALGRLSISQRQTVEKGLDLYVSALARNRVQSLYRIREIDELDNVYLAEIIRVVLTEFGANRSGFAAVDPETDRMFQTYTKPQSVYFVAHDVDGNVVGGGGLAPLKGGGHNVCELQKMYILSEARGYGLGRRILEACLEKAQEFGFRMVYIETLAEMERARDLYAKNGFKSIAQPMGNTGHDGCNFWMMKVV